MPIYKPKGNPIDQKPYQLYPGTVTPTFRTVNNNMGMNINYNNKMLMERTGGSGKNYLYLDANLFKGFNNDKVLRDDLQAGLDINLLNKNNTNLRVKIGGGIKNMLTDPVPSYRGTFNLDRNIGRRGAMIGFEGGIKNDNTIEMNSSANGFGRLYGQVPINKNLSVYGSAQVGAALNQNKQQSVLPSIFKGSQLQTSFEGGLRYVFPVNHSIKGSNKNPQKKPTLKFKDAKGGQYINTRFL